MDQLFNTQFNEYKPGWIDLFGAPGHCLLLGSYRPLLGLPCHFKVPNIEYSAHSRLYT